MASIINASVTSNGIVQTADASGILQLQSDGTTGLSVNTGGKVVYANTALATATAGMLEYDGKVPYFTPLGTQRGVINACQFYYLNNDVVGTNATGAQSVFGVGVTLSSSTIYYFEGMYLLQKSAGTTSYTMSTLFGGTATLNNISYWAGRTYDGSSSFTTANNTLSVGVIQVATAVTTMSAATAASASISFLVKGYVSVNSGGTFIPQYSLSAAPGGAYTTKVGSWFKISPVAASSASNINVGTWA